MKYQIFIAAVLSTASTCSGTSSAQAPASASHPHHAMAESVTQPFLGRWDISLNTPAGKQPSWIELYQEKGELKATFVSRWGSARPLSVVSVSDGKLTFVSSKEEEARKADMTFHGRLVGGKLVGSTTGPDGEVWSWVGVRAPVLSKAGTPKWGVPIKLFNGKNIDNWHEFAANYFPQPGHWTVENGTLVSPGNGPELVTDSKFQDFKLHLQFNCGPTSNSGVYLRGRYELQIENESADEPPSHHTAGIYGFLTASPAPARTTGQWQTYDITMIGRRVTVVLNGKTVIDNKEIPGITGGALDSHEGMPGPIYLQGSEKGHVSFRDILITPTK
jgi:hypothetical protein